MRNLDGWMTGRMTWRMDGNFHFIPTSWFIRYYGHHVSLRMEFAWIEALEKLIGSLWKCAWLLIYMILWVFCNSKVCGSFFSFWWWSKSWLKIMTKLWLWRESGLMDEELWWDVCLLSANQTYLKSFHRLSQRLMIFYLPHVDGARYAKLRGFCFDSFKVFFRF